MILWKVVGRVLELVTMVSVGLLLFAKNANTVLPQSEKLFYDYFRDEGNIKWIDDEYLFCKFMRPVKYITLGPRLQEDETVELSSQGGATVDVDILFCSYAQFQNTPSVAEYPYARGPNGKYYEMRGSPNTVGYWAIFSRVYKPDDEDEKPFYDHYDENGIISFDTLEEPFCTRRVPPYCSGLNSWNLKTHDVRIIEYQDDEEIRVEILHCNYAYRMGDDEVTFSYAEGPNGSYYEMRQWNFKNSGSSDDLYVIYREL